MVTAPVRDVAAGDAAEGHASSPDLSVPDASPRPAKWLVAAVAAALILPLAVAVFAFHKPTWAPVLDLAQTELRVRDVGTSHTPLIGLPGASARAESRAAIPAR